MTPLSSLPTTASQHQRKQNGGARRALLAGVDEVGRGPLAGPVMAGAVVLDPDLDAPWLADLRDSKVLPPRAREHLSACIQREALAWSCGLATTEEIDRLGIVPATRLAMRRAVAGLALSPDLLLVTAVPSATWARLPASWFAATPPAHPSPPPPSSPSRPRRPHAGAGRPSSRLRLRPQQGLRHLSAPGRPPQPRPLLGAPPLLPPLRATFCLPQT